MLNRGSPSSRSVRTCAAPAPKSRGSHWLRAAPTTSRIAPPPLPEPVLSAWRRSTGALVDCAINQPSIHLPSGIRIHLVGVRHDDAVNAGHVMRVLDAVQPDVVCLELEPGMHKAAKAVAGRLSGTVAKLSSVRDPADAFTVISESEQAQWNRAADKISWAAPLDPVAIAYGSLQCAEILSALAWAADHSALVDSIDDTLSDRDTVVAASDAMSESAWATIMEALRMSDGPPGITETQAVLQWWEDAMLDASFSLAVKRFAGGIFSRLLLPEDREVCEMMRRDAAPVEYAMVIDARDVVMGQRLRAMCSGEGRYKSWMQVRSIVAVVGSDHVPGLKQQLMNGMP